MLTTPLLLMFKLRMSGATPLLSLHAFMACRGTTLPLFLQFKIDFVCVCVCVCACICVHACACMCVWACTCACVCVCARVCVCV